MQRLISPRRGRGSEVKPLPSKSVAFPSNNNAQLEEQVRSLQAIGTEHEAVVFRYQEAIETYQNEIAEIRQKVTRAEHNQAILTQEKDCRDI